MYQLGVVVMEFVMMKVAVMDVMVILLVLECIEGMVEKVSSGSGDLIALSTFSRQVQIFTSCRKSRDYWSRDHIVKLSLVTEQGFYLAALDEHCLSWPAR